MKRLYFTFHGVRPAHAISHDLTATGIDQGQLHFLSKSTTELEAQGVNQATIFEEKDIGHSGLYGGMIGFGAGLVFSLLIASTTFAEYQTTLGFIFVVGLFTSFGFWAGGIVGISKDNHHIEKFHDDIEHGDTLLMLDAYDEQQEKNLKSIMTKRHQEARYRGEDAVYHQFL